MTRAERQIAYHLIQIKIERLKYQQMLIDEKIQNITNHLAGEGHSRRIKPCDINDPKETDCPWPLK